MSDTGVGTEVAHTTGAFDISVAYISRGDTCAGRALGVDLRTYGCLPPSNNGCPIMRSFARRCRWKCLQQHTRSTDSSLALTLLRSNPSLSLALTAWTSLGVRMGVWTRLVAMQIRNHLQHLPEDGGGLALAVRALLDDVRQQLAARAQLLHDVHGALVLHDRLSSSLAGRLASAVTVLDGLGLFGGA